MNDQKDYTWLWLVLIGLLVFSRMDGCKFLPPSLSPSKATQVTYVYEKDSGGEPSDVAAAISALNFRTPPVAATAHQHDTTDADAQVPDQYKIAVAEAKRVGMPTLVVQSGVSVISAIKDPKASDVEAVK